MTSHSLAALRNSLKKLVDSGGFDKVLDKLEILSVGKGTCLCEMKIHKEHQNRGGFLHGGMTSTLVDSVSTLALLHETQKPAVSIEMSISFLRPAAVGETVIIETNAVKVGKNLAFLTVDLKSKTTEKLIAQGKHTKYFVTSSS